MMVPPEPRYAAHSCCSTISSFLTSSCRAAWRAQGRLLPAPGHVRRREEGWLRCGGWSRYDQGRRLPLQPRCRTWLVPHSSTTWWPLSSTLLPWATRSSSTCRRKGGVRGHGTARHGTARHGTARHGTARHGTARHGTARHATPRHATPRHATPRHGTARHLSLNCSTPCPCPSLTCSPPAPCPSLTCSPPCPLPQPDLQHALLHHRQQQREARQAQQVGGHCQQLGHGRAVGHGPGLTERRERHLVDGCGSRSRGGGGGGRCLWQPWRRRRARWLARRPARRADGGSRSVPRAICCTPAAAAPHPATGSFGWGRA